MLQICDMIFVEFTLCDFESELFCIVIIWQMIKSYAALKQIPPTGIPGILQIQPIHIFLTGARYTTAKWSKQATMEGGGRDGVELVEEKVYHDKEWNVSGTYTHKIYHIGGYDFFEKKHKTFFLLICYSWIPSWVKSLLPASALKVEEKAYNAFPYCKTTMSSPFLGSRFSLTVESIHLPYENGKEENALKIASDKLKTR